MVNSTPKRSRSAFRERPLEADQGPGCHCQASYGPLPPPQTKKVIEPKVSGDEAAAGPQLVIQLLVGGGQGIEYGCAGSHKLAFGHGNLKQHSEKYDELDRLKLHRAARNSTGGPTPVIAAKGKRPRVQELYIEAKSP